MGGTGEGGPPTARSTRGTSPGTTVAGDAGAGAGPAEVGRTFGAGGPAGTPILGREARAKLSTHPPRIRRETPIATVSPGVLAVADELEPEILAFVGRLDACLVDPRTVVAAVRALAASLPCVSDRDTLGEGEAVVLSPAERLTLLRMMALAAVALNDPRGSAPPGDVPAR